MSGKRTYLPTLLKLVRTLCVYITRHSETIRDNLNSTEKTLLDALETACHAFIDAYDENIP